MPVPRIFFAVPFLVAGVVVPALGADPLTPAAGALGMDHEAFTSDVVRVHQGDTLTLVNNSRWAHTIGPGRDGRIIDAAGVPATGLHLMQTDDVDTTGKWTEPGTFFLTCSVHPDMTVKVIVDDCACCSGGACQ